MKRYPGIRPFRTDEQALFFGRDADIERLHRLIDLEQLVILYGKSGYGKSSLLSAGIFPRLQAEGRRQFWEVRFGPYKPGESAAPADAARGALLRGAPEKPLLPDALAGPGLWQALKNRQAAGENHFLLVFDQFEELFSYPPEQILEFKKQLAEALYSKVPKRYENALHKSGLRPEQEDALYAPFDLKVVFSIRSDRMSLLNGLKDYLPNLLQHGYELDALDEAAATEAVVRPAQLGIADTITPSTVHRPPSTVHRLPSTVHRSKLLSSNTPPTPSPPFSPPCATSAGASKPPPCRSCAAMWKTTWPARKDNSFARPTWARSRTSSGPFTSAPSRGCPRPNARPPAGWWKTCSSKTAPACPTPPRPCWRSRA